VAIDQLRRLKPLFGKRRVIVLADHWYGTPEMLRACHELGYSVLIRLKSNRKLYRKPVRRFKLGRPPQDGPLLQGTRPETLGDPSATWETSDQQGRITRVSRFDEVHFQQDRDLLLSVIRVERTSAQGTRRDPRLSWFLTLDTQVPLEQVPQRYGLRFSEEHLFRFLKQDLLWLAAHLRTPEQGSALELDRRSGLFPVVSGSRAWSARALAVGSQRASGDSSADSPGHAHAFVSAWHTGPSVPTTRKSARTRQRVFSQTCNASPDHLQNEQQEAKEQNGSLGLR
jgi:hypothetical protein